MNEGDWPEWMPRRETVGGNPATVSYPYPATYTGKHMANRARIPNARVQRHIAIRRIVNGRAGALGVRNYRDLRDTLAEEGIPVSEMTVRSDMAELGAVKIKDEKTNLSWWIIPAWNPAAENLRGKLDPEVVEHEVMLKMTAHASDAVIVGDRIHVMTEPRAGYLVAYWISWLDWHGIVDVLERLDGCIIYCASAEDARVVRSKLLGEEGSTDDGSEDG